MKKNRIMISGGGTGGHIFPAIAIADAIKAIDAKAEFLFVGAKGRMEMEKVPQAGYEIEGLWISGLQRRLTWANISFPFKVLSSILKAKKLIKKFKPTAVVGVGGYASGPLLYVASKKGIPCLIQEQNSYPGITNKLLKDKVRKICVAYDGMERFFPKDKIIITGNPVRKTVMDEVDRVEAAKHFELDPNKKTILVIGGSLGARSINESIKGDLNRIIDSNYQLLWQTGNFYYKDIINRVGKRLNSRTKVTEFIKRMDYAYALADVVISRAGAIAISELCVVKKPVILVPSPNVAEDHQTKNAQALEKVGAAIMIKDIESKALLVNKTLELLNDEATQEKMILNIQKLGKPNASEEIAKEVLSLKK